MTAADQRADARRRAVTDGEPVDSDGRTAMLTG